MPGITITFTQEDGTERALTGIAIDQSLMEAGKANGVEGILADCGGSCACATCHVYVDPEWQDRVGPPNQVELEMLDMVSDIQRDNSRLSCQVRLSEALDGLKVTVAPNIW